MKLLLLTIGKPKLPGLAALCEEYFSRLAHYTKCEWLVCKSEAELLSKIDPADFVVICDEKGKQFTSQQFSEQVQKWQNGSAKRVVIMIGGASGHSEDFLQQVRAKNVSPLQMLSFSNFTLQHEFAFALLLEQLYRAFTILKGEPYHRV